MFDVGVVGLGLMGAATLRHLATAGVRCVGVGPDEPAVFADHDGPFASHYDSGRITRVLDTNLIWARLAQRAIAGYAALEADWGDTFHRPVGFVSARLDAATNAALEDVANRLGVVHRVGGPADERLALPAGTTIIEEPAPAGHLDSRRMRAAQVAVAERNGAVVQRSAATAVQRHRGGWRVLTTSGAAVDAERLVVALGPYADRLPGLPERLAYTVRSEAVFMAVIGADEQRRLAGLPAAIVDTDSKATDHFYLVPPTSYPDGTVRIKVGAALDIGRQLPEVSDRNGWMTAEDHNAHAAVMGPLLRALVPGLETLAETTMPCLISNTPTGLPYIDHLDDGLVIAAGGNGYAGKSADAIGVLAAGLVSEGRWTDNELDEESFRARVSAPPGATV